MRALAVESWEVVFVNDGSKDRSLSPARELAPQEPRYRVDLASSRNFGHQRAITAGMDTPRGDAVVVMDADLQDPPEVIPEMLAKWREGYDVVYGRAPHRARARLRSSSLTATLFYRALRRADPDRHPARHGRLPPDEPPRRRRAARAARAHRFVRGLVAWVGFKQTAVEYDRAGALRRRDEVPARKMLRFAIDGITSFCILPLRFAT